MNKRIALNRKATTAGISLCLAIILSGIQAATPETGETSTHAIRQEYILTYYKTAIRQQKKYHIPASIILAQALLESGAGQSYLALAGNNHFGIKCTGWKGLCIYKNDDGQNTCFRKYLYPADSFEDHSRFLADRPFYRSLFKLSKTDYKGWANGLKQCGYATDPQYSAKLISLIESYRLYYYDTAKETDPPAWTKKNNTTLTSKK
jgi:flagellum-specific peptidoglycan hydrolase FlgJ